MGQIEQFSFFDVYPMNQDLNKCTCPYSKVNTRTGITLRLMLQTGSEHVNAI